MNDIRVKWGVIMGIVCSIIVVTYYSYDPSFLFKVKPYMFIWVSTWVVLYFAGKEFLLKKYVLEETDNTKSRIRKITSFLFITMVIGTTFMKFTEKAIINFIDPITMEELSKEITINNINSFDITDKQKEEWIEREKAIPNGFSLYNTLFELTRTWIVGFLVSLIIAFFVERIHFKIV